MNVGVRFQHSISSVGVSFVVDDDQFQCEIGASAAHAAQGTENFVGVSVVDENDADGVHGRHIGHLAGRGWPVANLSEFHQTPAPQKR